MRGIAEAGAMEGLMIECEAAARRSVQETPITECCQAPDCVVMHRRMQNAETKLIQLTDQLHQLSSLQGNSYPQLDLGPVASYAVASDDVEAEELVATDDSSTELYGTPAATPLFSCAQLTALSKRSAITPIRAEDYTTIRAEDCTPNGAEEYGTPSLGAATPEHGTPPALGAAIPVQGYHKADALLEEHNADTSTATLMQRVKELEAQLREAQNQNSLLNFALESDFALDSDSSSDESSTAVTSMANESQVWQKWYLAQALQRVGELEDLLHDAQTQLRAKDDQLSNQIISWVMQNQDPESAQPRGSNNERFIPNESRLCH